MTNTKITDQLSSFLRGEMSACETYKQAIEKLAKTTYVAKLQSNLRSHEERVTTLKDAIARQGGEVPESSGAWGTFAKIIEGGAAAFGEKAAIYALEEGEDHGRNDYQRELKDATGELRDITQKLLSKQLETHQVLSDLKKSMAGDKSVPRYPGA